MAPDWMDVVLTVLDKYIGNFVDKALETYKLGDGIHKDTVASSIPECKTAMTNVEGTKIELKFNKEMGDPVDKHTQFEVKMDDVDNPPTAAGGKENATDTIELTLTNMVLPGKTITVKYAKGAATERIKCKEDIDLLDFPAPMPVTNNSKAPPYFESAETNTKGDEVSVTFKEAVEENASTKYETFKVKQENADKAIDSIARKGTADPDDKVLILTMTDKVEPEKPVKLLYTKGAAGNMVKIGGNEMEKFAVGVPVTNNVTPPPGFESAEVIPDGSKIEMKFNNQMVSIADHTKFTVNDGAANAVTGASVNTNNDHIIDLELTTPITSEKTVKVAYSGDGEVKDIEDQELGAIEETQVINPIYTSSESTVDGKNLWITFDKEMADPSADAAKFLVQTGDGTIMNDNVVERAGLKSGDNKVIELAMTDSIAKGMVIKASYDGTGAVGTADGARLVAFTEQEATNNSKAPKFFQGAEIIEEGAKVEMKFDAEMEDPAGKHALFKVRVSKPGGATAYSDNVVKATALKGAGDPDFKSITLEVTEPITGIMGVDVLYKGTDTDKIKTAAGAELDDFEEYLPLLNPRFKSAETPPDGTMVVLQMDKKMGTIGDHTKFIVKVADTANDVTGAALKQGDPMAIELKVKTLIPTKKKVTVEYDGTGDVQASNTLTLFKFGAQSVTNKVIPPPTVKGKGVTTPDGNKVEVTFTKDMADPVGKHAQFTLKEDNTDKTFSAAEMKVKSKRTIELTVDEAILHEKTLKLAYTFEGDLAKAVKSADGGLLTDFTEDADLIEVTNKVIEAPTYDSSTTLENGKKVQVKFSKKMAAPKGKETQFLVEVAGAKVNVTEAALVSGTPEAIALVTERTILHGEDIAVSYEAGDVTSSDKGTLGSFGPEDVTPDIKEPPTIDASGTETTPDGKKIRVKFSKAMANPGGKHAQFKIDVDGAENKATAAALDTSDKTIVELALTDEIPYEKGGSVKLSYTYEDEDAKKVAAEDGGVLATIEESSAIAVVNKITQPPEFASAETSQDGTKVYVTFNKPMKSPAGMHSQFSVEADGADDEVTGATMKSGDDKTFELTMKTAIEHAKPVKLNYTAGSIASVDGGKLVSFAAQEDVENLVMIEITQL